MEILLPYIPGRSEASRRAKFKQITKPPLYMCVGGGGIGGGGGFPKTGLTEPPLPLHPGGYNLAKEHPHVIYANSGCLARMAALDRYF